MVSLTKAATKSNDFSNNNKNDEFSGAKRAAPQRPREQPPSLPRSPSPLLGSMSSLQDVLKVNDTL